ncbi:MAG TPA: AAA family ATPase [Bryobacterales bacterium]|nr:AAA family ATPase [Bryobacterales bacterium]
MYVEHFGLKEQPFGATPDPRFLYCSPAHAEALAALHYGLSERRGLLVLTARPGMGKTTLLHYLLEHWKDRARTAFLFQTPRSPEQMMAAVLEDLGLACNSGWAESCRLLHAAALECRRQGKRLVLVFDEAQDMPAALLEQIRLLSNFETPEEKLIEIVLAGQPSLAERLKAPEWEQLRQRVAVWAELVELDDAEVRRYVEHRLRVAGSKRKRLFTRSALAWLARQSQGVPRNINTLCFEALSSAFAEGKKKVGERQVRRVVDGESRTRVVPGPLRWAAVSATGILAVGLLAGAVRFPDRVPVLVDAVSALVTPAAPAFTAASEAPPAPAELVRIGPCDTLEQVALRKYARWDPQVWEQIQKANPGVSDPDEVTDGRLLFFPPARQIPRGAGQAAP